MEALWSPFHPIGHAENGSSRFTRPSELTGSKGLRFGGQLDTINVVSISEDAYVGRAELHTLLTVTAPPKPNLSLVPERATVSQDGGLTHRGVEAAR